MISMQEIPDNAERPNFKEFGIRVATWLDSAAEKSKNENFLLKDGESLKHSTVWFGLGIAALTGIKMISNLESNGNIDMSGLHAIGKWLDAHGYTGEFIHESLGTYGKVDQIADSAVFSGNTNLSSLREIAHQIGIDPRGESLLLDQIGSPGEGLRYQSLWQQQDVRSELSQDWLKLSNAMYEQIVALNKTRGWAGLAKLTVGLATIGAIGLASLKQKGGEPVKISAPIHTPFGEIPSAADSIQALCKRFIPQA